MIFLQSRRTFALSHSDHLVKSVAASQHRIVSLLKPDAPVISDAF